MEKRHYKDYFIVPANYTAAMTREAINETPETWLDFYPHEKYLNFLRTLFDESLSVWMTGNYGTGKSNAALVTQKLFMDDISRVNQWFERYHNVIANCNDLKKQLVAARESGILVVYDYNASGVGPTEEFLVRLEKGLLSALKEHGYSAPAKANLDLVIDRLRREGEHFFQTRDLMKSELRSLKSDIRSVEQLIVKLREEQLAGETPTHYFDDVQAVLHRDNIFLSVDVPTFRTWIESICKANSLSRIIYIFDEFSDFIDENSGMLKTFEDVTEAPAVNHFYLVPVTHKEMSAFYGEKSGNAQKAKDRFYFRNLQMPNDIAFQLAAHAMKPVEEEPYKTEWKNERDNLWNSIVTVVDKFNAPETSEAYVSRESFYNVLPIHPMAAFLLKFLAESARSNQRSIFEYLKGSANGHEFQEFVSSGGPSITNKQFLTIDYLWKYFVEREDLGQRQEIAAIRMEYGRIKAREFINYDDTQPEIRVLKTVMLFSLYSRFVSSNSNSPSDSNSHVRLRPTVENVELSFRGDGAVMDVKGILRDLAENKHCFSIINGNIDLYSTTVGNDDLEKEKEKLSGNFHKLLSDTCKTEIEDVTKRARSGFSSERFDIRVSDVGNVTLMNISPTTRDKYGIGLNKDNGSVCLWFVVAKDRADQLQIQEKQEAILRNLRGHRIVMFAFPEVTFCEKNVNLWDEYVTLRAQYTLENNTVAKKQILNSCTRIEEEWTGALKAQGTVIDIRYYDADVDQIVMKKSSWANLKNFLHSYIKKVMDCCPDIITDQITVFNNKGLQNWALAGIHFSGTSQQGQLVDYLKSQGIRGDDIWFAGNPNHLFSKIRALFVKKYNNTVGKGTNLSIRKVYIEVQRAPYGMRYNCLSAFTLGFCLRWVLDKNCQWTNNQMTYPLDDKTLAEIIETAVSGKTDKEKFICRLSEAERMFAEKAGCMFGLPVLVDSTPKETMHQISLCVEKTSYKVPLWVLAKYIRSSDCTHERAAQVLENLCVALKTSSKGNIIEGAAAVTGIGSELHNHPDLIETIAEYTKPDIYLTAFWQYIDKADPSFSKLAEKVEDRAHEYCDMILNQLAKTAGWLWNESDISAEIEKAKYAYQVMDIARDFLKLNGYASYEEILTRLTQKLAGSGLPYKVVGAKYSALAQLIEELNGNRTPKVLFEALRNGSGTLELLYNDSKKELAIQLVREYVDNIRIDNDGLLSIIREMPSTAGYDADMSIDAYIKLIRTQIEKNIRNTLIRNISQEWKRISGAASAFDWSYETNLPVWTAFANVENANELVRVLRVPNDFSNDALTQKLEYLKRIPKISVKQCQDAFLQRVVAKRYKKLNIDLASLLKYLRGSKYGKDPNQWPERPDISEFINEQYQLVFAPDVLRQLQDEDAEVLKGKLLEMVKTDPYIGLRYLEQ